MKVLCVQPGSTFSTADVFDGLTGALSRAGHDVQEYRLDYRIEEACEYQGWRERRRRKAQPETPHRKPAQLMPEVIRQASMTLLEAALTVNPHWILIFSGQFLHPDTMRLLYRMGAKTALVLTESPYDDGKQGMLTPYARVVFTNERASVGLLRRWYEQTSHDPFNVRGAKTVHYLPHAYDPGRHWPGSQDGDVDSQQVPRHDIVFVGSGFIERQEMLAGVDWEGLGVDFGLYGHWRYLGSRNHLRRYLHDGLVPNETTAALYRNATLGLNLYRQSVGSSRNATRIAGAESLNPRALELAATGTPHISDWRPEVEEVFGDTVPTFKTSAELERLVADLLLPGPDCYRLARMQTALPQAVAGWTLDARAAQLVACLADADAQS
jgi:hypothetical protein